MITHTGLPKSNWSAVLKLK